MNDEIKHTLGTPGWEMIEAWMDDELSEAKKIKTEARRYEDIAIEAIANEKISKAWKNLKARLYRIKNAEQVKKERYV